MKSSLRFQEGVAFGAARPPGPAWGRRPALLPGVEPLKRRNVAAGPSLPVRDRHISPFDMPFAPLVVRISLT